MCFIYNNKKIPMNEYYESLPKKSRDRYMKKTSVVYNTITNLIKNNELSFEPFDNVAISKNMIKYRIDFDYNEKTLPLAVEAGVVMFIIKSIKSIKNTQAKINNEEDFYDFLDDNINIEFDNNIDKQLHSYKYLFIGEDFLEYDSKININKDRMFYYGEYKNLKVYHIPELKNSYLTNNSILNFNSLSSIYMDTKDIEIEDMSKFKGHKMIINFNSILGDVKMIEIVK